MNWKEIKQWILSIFIGRYYTEKEVKEILSKMQHEMAQRIIGNRPNTKPIVPIEFWMENAKYDTDLYKLGTTLKPKGVILSDYTADVNLKDSQLKDAKEHIKVLEQEIDKLLKQLK